jgi:predicted MFS family arabinose efflux permease
MFLLFALLFGTGQFHRVSTSVLVPELTAELNLGANALGGISAVYFLCGALMQIPIGMCLDRFGTRRTLPVLLLMASTGTYLFATAHDIPGLMLGRALMGMGFASSMVAAFIVFARWVPPEKFATTSSRIIALGSVGGLLATTPLAYAVSFYGWRLPILAVCAMTIAMLALIIGLVRDAPPGLRPLEGKPSSLAGNLAGLWSVMKDRQMRYILIMGFATFGPGMVLLGLWGGPFLADVHGLDAIDRGYLLLAMALMAPLGLMVIGPLDRYFNSHKKVVILSALGMALGFAFLAIAGQVSLWLVGPVMLWTMFAQAYYVTLHGHCRALFPAGMAGRAATLVNLVAVAGIALMQICSGLLMEAFPSPTGIADSMGYRLTFAATALILVFCTACYARADDVPVRPALE